MSLALKPAHTTVKAYYEALHQFGQLYIDHEGAVRSAFQTLLAKCGQKANPKLTLVPEYRIERARSSVIVDGALVDLYHLPHGYWEAKDEKDDLAREVERKLEKGYPRDNIIFQAPERAILYQGGVRVFDENISRPEPLVDIVNAFFDYKAPHIQEWEEAVRDFSERIPELAAAVKKTIDEERKRSPSFVRSFDDFYALCRQAINPNLSEEAVERMLVQHLLTERIFRKIFNNPDFTSRNVVAAEIEKVIRELTKRSLNRDEFLGNLERFYRAIERSAEETTNFSEKQAFLNKVYERFFQGYSPKEADTHGIVYTPQPIVNFMVRSVEEILRKEFSRSLGNKDVHILDPFVGTGNFIVRIMQEIKTTDLQYKYENELHCNEVMLLPYYIASMNIEHAYFDRTSEYKPFPGICLVDTFELAEPKQSQLSFMTAENAERVKRQKESPIFVIIGNPPYNAWPADENDNNKNRKYPTVDARLTDTYAKDSSATNKVALRDPYIKAIRWASDRLGDQGIVALVTKNTFASGRVTDGVRKHLSKDFDKVFVLDLGGSIRDNEKLSGTTHNVFGIRVGVSINFFVRASNGPARSQTDIYYYKTDEFWTKHQKYHFLDGLAGSSQITWTTVPSSAKDWALTGVASDFDLFFPLARPSEGNAIFDLHSNGLKSNRDQWVYNMSREELARNIRRVMEFYNAQVARWKQSDKRTGIDSFVTYDDTSISWSRDLKLDVKRGHLLNFRDSQIRSALYRPFTQSFVYFDKVLNEEVYALPRIFPDQQSERDNRAIVCTTDAQIRFSAQMVCHILCVHLGGRPSQCFPFYTYDEDGTDRRENISDWALEQFRTRYGERSITKWDIFHYIYAVLHHPEYCQRYAANLRRELPRIPFASASSGVKDVDVFRALVKAGQRLAEIHVNYERQPEYPLTKTERREKSWTGPLLECA